jgi:hypothetical protein
MKNINPRKPSNYAIILWIITIVFFAILRALGA